MRSRLGFGAVAVGFAVVLAGCSSGSDSATGTTPSPTAASLSMPASSSSTSASTSRTSSASSSASTRPSVSSSRGSATAGESDFDLAAAEAYCRQVGGTVQPRQAYWGTNADQTDWLALAGTTSMCRFQTDDEAKSRIYVDLATLASKEPTLAALAYQSKVPMPSVTGGANPATSYCSKELGGSSTFGTVGAAGGGWVAQDDPDDVVVALCVFPDQSFIDEWGLAYHSNGEIRGKDLSTVMQYQTGTLPPVYAAAETPGGSGSEVSTPSGLGASSSASTPATPTS